MIRDRNKKAARKEYKEVRHGVRRGTPCCPGALGGRLGDVRGGSLPAVTDSRGDKGKGSNAANMIQNTIITKILQVPKLKRFF